MKCKDIGAFLYLYVGCLGGRLCHRIAGKMWQYVGLGGGVECLNMGVNVSPFVTVSKGNYFRKYTVRGTFGIFSNAPRVNFI